MNLYLASWQGNGTPQNKFRPAGVDGIGVSWGCVDLRPNPALLAGFCLLATDANIVDPGARLLSTNPAGVITGQDRLAIEAALGLSLQSAVQTNDVIRRLMFDDHGPGFHKPARPEKDGKRRIWINSAVWADE